MWNRLASDCRADTHNWFCGLRPANIKIAAFDWFTRPVRLQALTGLNIQKKLNLCHQAPVAQGFWIAVMLLHPKQTWPWNEAIVLIDLPTCMSWASGWLLLFSASKHNATPVPSSPERLNLKRSQILMPLVKLLSSHKRASEAARAWHRWNPSLSEECYARLQLFLFP